MKHFSCVDDVADVHDLIKLGIDLKQNPFANEALGKGKTLGMVFFNSSLRTRMSTQKAAQNLGMECIVMNINSDAWKIETEYGVIMNGDTAEHIQEAAGVMGRYCDILAIRSFPKLVSREEDAAETILNCFKKYAGVPIVSLESPTLHPLQSLADLITIEEKKIVERPKVVLTWAPHPRALPQAVPNSFSEWMNKGNVDFVITHPEGYELDKKFTGEAPIIYNQDEALEGADFVYAKNWSSYKEYGSILSQDTSWQVTKEKMDLTNNGLFMHCLPVRRNVIVSDEVLDSPSSIVLDQAENRVYSAQAVLMTLLKNS